MQLQFHWQVSSPPNILLVPTNMNSSVRPPTTLMYSTILPNRHIKLVSQWYLLERCWLLFAVADVDEVGDSDSFILHQETAVPSQPTTTSLSDEENIDVSLECSKSSAGESKRNTFSECIIFFLSGAVIVEVGAPHDTVSQESLTAAVSSQSKTIVIDLKRRKSQVFEANCSSVSFLSNEALLEKSRRIAKIGVSSRPMTENACPQNLPVVDSSSPRLVKRSRRSYLRISDQALLAISPEIQF